MRLSIVSTMYNSARYLEEFYSRICASAAKVASDFEIILVNDGTQDDSLEIALKIQQADERVRVVDLSRNFGHHKAIMTGLSFARGELVFLIDCDLEEAPELLEYFYKEHSASCVDVVFGVQEKRKGDLFERISGGIFYMMFNWLSDVAIPKNVLTVRLMSKRYVASLLKHREREVFLAGLMHMAGFSQLPLAVNKEDKGQTSYTIWKKLSLMVNAITSFSNRPLVYIFHTGLLITLGAILYIAYTLVKKVVLGIDVPGWTTTILSIFVFSGVIILFQGVIGIYVAKIYIESKQRPYTIIRALYNCEETPEGRDEYISNH